MPLIVMADLLVALFLMNHVRQTGRPDYWYLIILMVPFVGSIAYVCFELIPDMGNTRRGQKATKGIADILSPDREFNRLHDAARTTGSVETKQQLAEECERKGMWHEAIQLYTAAAQGMYANDANLLARLARAHLGNGTAHTAIDILDKLRAEHPDLDDQEAHLTYARCLEALGRDREAEGEYAELSKYYIVLEARTRYALLLTRKGEPEKARNIFDSVVRASAARGIVLTDNDKAWLKVAKSNV